MRVKVQFLKPCFSLFFQIRTDCVENSQQKHKAKRTRKTAACAQARARRKDGQGAHKARWEQNKEKRDL